MLCATGYCTLQCPSDSLHWLIPLRFFWMSKMPKSPIARHCLTDGCFAEEYRSTEAAYSMHVDACVRVWG